MPARIVKVPVITIGKEEWLDLGHWGHKHRVRGQGCTQPKQVADPNGHRLREVTFEGSVKWMPRQPITIEFSEMKPYSK